MQYTPVEAPVTVNDLYVAHSRFGIDGLIKLGYIHAVAGTVDSSRKFTLTVPVVGDPDDRYGPSYVQGQLDYSGYKLTEAPLLLAFVGGVPDSHVPSVDLFNVTKDGCSFIVRQSAIMGSVTEPLDSTLTVIALK